MCISLTHDFTPVLWACGGMGQLGRVQLPNKRLSLVVVGNFCAESFLGESLVVSLVYALLYQLQKREVDICVPSHFSDKYTKL